MSSELPASSGRSQVIAKILMAVLLLTGLLAIVPSWPTILESRRASAAAAAAGLAVLSFEFAVLDWVGRISWRRRARWRVWKELKVPHSSRGWASRTHQSLLRSLDVEPVVTRLAIVNWMLAYWSDAGLGDRATHMIFVWVVCTGLGSALIEWLSGSVLLAGLGSLLVTIGLATVVALRALAMRRRFAEQLPDLLDRLADCLEAGFSLPQAFEFVRPNMPEPASSETLAVVRQVNLGYSIDEALEQLGRRRPGPELELLIEGLVLQRQLGGNMTDLMRGVAGFVRTRQALEAEVRTLTAQGRLSAVVIALLVPASLILLSFFPGYVTELLRTTIGNLILVAAAMLELLGAAIVARVVRVEY